MWKRFSLGIVIALLAALISGCSWLWGEPLYQIVLNVEGLSTCSSAHVISWQAQSPGRQEQTGIVDVADATLQIPLKIAPGVWQFSLQLTDADGF